jgi:hypothetical protein
MHVIAIAMRTGFVAVCNRYVKRQLRRAHRHRLRVRETCTGRHSGLGKKGRRLDWFGAIWRAVNGAIRYALLPDVVPLSIGSITV